MARTRLLKPGFFSNDILAECDPLARILFAGLWTLVDRDGRMECRHAKIKAQLLPYDNCDVAALMEQLAARGFVQVYTVDGKTYIQVNGFAKHQNPHPRETSDGLPEPPQNTGETQGHGNSMTSHGNSEAGLGNPGTSRAFSLLPSPLSLNPSPREIHTHTPREPRREKGGPPVDDTGGWALDEWTRFAAAWNATERAEPWRHLTPPDGWADLAAAPGWLQRAREALDILPSRRFFDRPLPVTRFFEYLDRIRAGEFADPKEQRNGRAVAVAGKAPRRGNL